MQPSDVADAFALNGIGVDRPEPPAYDRIPEEFDDERREPIADATRLHLVTPSAPLPPLQTTTPAAWRDVPPEAQRWVVPDRIPLGDLTLYCGNGGSGKTETAVALAVAVAAGLGDWLGKPLDLSGPVLFLSCEEPEANVRDRVERISKHRALDPYAIEGLHLHFPDLEATWLGTGNPRTGRVEKTALLQQLERWMEECRPVLVVIDSIAAVFDGDAIVRRQVRQFLAMLRKLAMDRDAAMVLLDHPSVRGMSDGSGTANSVDWRNSVRSMLHLSDPDREDPDVRELEVKKSNRGRVGEKVKLRWNGLTFSTLSDATASYHRAAAERDIEELFLRLLDRRNAQGRPVHGNTATGSAPSEFALDPEAAGISSGALRAAMERLFTRGEIKNVETGPPSKRRQHIERASP
ncbi:AAA family ATPase [Bradyrhizobium sp. BRP19]|uniref:AAA family ATPase n=1 Tax=Bradyrhizobium sp. BRP19 TaxID=2793823 RepID=UPI001CD4A5F7|nr:AAA family ATPase [Bradyrhizobium sp. BRP19]MCA1546313.1 AAA family ATPase [Bradyrhizobium sp. BRP19]